MGLDVKPVMKLVAGTTDHYVAELPDDVLAAHGITTRAGYDDPGAVDAVDEIVAETIDEAAAAVQDALKVVTGEEVDKATALKELAEAAQSAAQEGGDK